jgi:hypothetical protein
MKRLDIRIANYLRELEKNDSESSPSSSSSSIDNTSAQHAREEIQKLKSKKTEYSNLLAKLEESGQTEISLTDPEFKSMKNNTRRQNRVTMLRCL